MLHFKGLAALCGSVDVELFLADYPQVPSKGAWTITHIYPELTTFCPVNPHLQQVSHVLTH